MTSHYNKLICLLIFLACAAAGLGRPTYAADLIADHLAHDDVYLSRHLDTAVSEATLRRAASERSADFKPLKIALVRQLTPENLKLGSEASYAQSLFNVLKLGHGTLILQTAKGLYIVSGSVPSEKCGELARDYRARVASDPERVLPVLIHALASAASPAPRTHRRHAPTPVVRPRSPALTVISLLLLLLAAGFGVKQLRKLQEFSSTKEEVTRLRRGVEEGVAFLDSYLDLLPDGDAARAAHEARDAGVEQWREAQDFLMRSERGVADYQRAAPMFEQAQTTINAGRGYVNQATGGTGLAASIILGAASVPVAESPATSIEVPASSSPCVTAPILKGLNSDQIPAGERSACFFCSRPAALGKLIPVMLSLDGRRRKVFACPSDVAAIQVGTMPQIRAVPNSEGEPLPWYLSAQYDPYKNYEDADPVYLCAESNVTEQLPDGVSVRYPIFVTSAGDPTNDSSAAWQVPESRDLPDSA